MALAGAELIAVEKAWGGLAHSYRCQIWLERAALRGLIGVLAPRPEEILLGPRAGCRA